MHVQHHLTYSFTASHPKRLHTHRNQKTGRTETMKTINTWHFTTWKSQPNLDTVQSHKGLSWWTTLVKWFPSQNSKFTVREETPEAHMKFLKSHHATSKNKQRESESANLERWQSHLLFYLLWHSVVKRTVMPSKW